MSSQTSSQLASYIERARKVLQYEQRANHQDSIVRGGLERFASHWANEVSGVCKNAGIDARPIHHFIEHLEGYRRQDPMQRAASLRAALAVLNDLGTQSGDRQDCRAHEFGRVIQETDLRNKAVRTPSVTAQGKHRYSDQL